MLPALTEDLRRHKPDHVAVTGDITKWADLWDPRLKGKVGEQEFTIYAEVLQRVQSRLTALGLYQGAPEAEFGDRTREALAAFQRSSNLQPTGLPDQATLWRLLRRPDGGSALR